MARNRIEVPALSAEFSDADLGDVRLNRRLGLLADRLGERPGESFPKALDDAELEAAYRFFGNDSVSPEAILAPHFGRRLDVQRSTNACWSSTTRPSSSSRAIPSARGLVG